MESSISRREMLKMGGAATAGAAGLAMMGGLSQAHADEAADEEAVAEEEAAEEETAVEESVEEESASTDATPSFFAQPDPITDIAETKDYDVVVVGAGAAGVPAAISAFQNGASVAVLQKDSTATSQGNTCTSILYDESDAAGVEDIISMITEDCCHRSKREQVELWAYNSGEALQWLWNIGEECGAEMSETTAKWTSSIQEVDGYNVSYFSFDFGPKPYNTGNGMQDIAAWAEEQGVEFFYSTPAVQLVQDDSGAVTGVIAESEDGYIQFNAAKGVIVATGDYENDDEMMAYYHPDMENIWRKESNKTGDGQKMMVWAGGRMEPVCGSKVLHDFDAGPGSMADMPFLCVKNDGTRFCNEYRSSMAVMGNFLTSAEDSGYYTQVFDSDYMTTCADWPGALVDEESMKNYMPEEEGEKEGVYEALIATYSADTIEELGEKLGLTDVDTFVATVERYNELCELGVDEDMGKLATYMVPIQTPPFYGIHRHIGVSTVIHGVVVNGDMQVLDENDEPIEGLYAIGNCAGGFFGSPDYPMTVPGLSLGRAHTEGYVVGRAVATK